MLERQRMDFLMLLDANVRIVIEVDGKKHAEGDLASPSFTRKPLRRIVDYASRVTNYIASASVRNFKM